MYCDCHICMALDFLCTRRFLPIFIRFLCRLKRAPIQDLNIFLAGTPGFLNCFCPGSQYVCVRLPPGY